MSASYGFFAFRQHQNEGNTGQTVPQHFPRRFCVSFRRTDGSERPSLTELRALPEQRLLKRLNIHISWLHVLSRAQRRRDARALADAEHVSHRPP